MNDQVNKMLFRFEPHDISFQKVKIKNISKAFGGTLTIVDEERSELEGKEVYKRYAIPHSLERVFRDKYKIKQFFVPVEGCIMMYRGNVIAIEKAVFNERTYEDSNGEIKEWQPTMEAVFRKIRMMIYSGDWYFDGSYIYSFGKDHVQAIAEGEPLTIDGKFRSVNVNAIRITYAGFANEIYEETRQCIAYMAADGQCSVSPPIWKHMSGLGNSNLKKRNNDSELIGLTTQFDKVDAIMAVNLNFALTAGVTLTKHFGYKSISPLQLPKLMVQLKTVNLPRIAQEIKQTFDIGMTFTQTIAWLLGLQMNVTDYDQMLALRKLFKYLSIKGIFARKTLTDIYVEPGNFAPMLTLEQATTAANELRPYNGKKGLAALLNL